MDNQNTFQEQKLEKVGLATLRSRISAYIVDVVLFMFPEAIISFIFLTYFLWGKEYITTGIKEYLFSQINIFGWYLWGALFIYSGVLIGKYRWTLGKRYAAMAVVRANTFQKISYLRAFLREIIKWGLHSIPYVSFLVLLVNLYLISSTKKKQAIHDKIAGTQVVTIPESKRVKKILNSVAIILFIGAVVAFGVFYSIAKEVKVKPGEEKIISANEYMHKAEVELTEVKKYTEENNVVEIQRHTAKALEYAILATDLEPSNPEIWFRRGNLYWEIKDISQGAEDWALKCYRKALELDPNNLIYRQKVEELTNWKTYKNEEYGFEVKYPGDWQIGVSTVKSIKINKLTSGSYIEIIKNNNENRLTLDEWFKELTIVNGRPTVKAGAQPTFINGVKAYRLDSELESPNPLFEIVGIADSQRRIFTLFAYSGEFDDNKILEQILSTFRFLE